MCSKVESPGGSEAGGGRPYGQFVNGEELSPRHSGAMQSIEPGISRFRVRLYEAPRNDSVCQCDRIFDKNFCARSLRGLPKKSVFSASSTISPLSMKITRLATLLAKPISWVTTIMVMPSWA